MKKIVILLLACCILPMQAQYVGKTHRNDEYTERLIQQAKLLYNEHSFDTAKELLNEVKHSNPTHLKLMHCWHLSPTNVILCLLRTLLKTT